MKKLSLILFLFFIMGNAQTTLSNTFVKQLGVGVAAGLLSYGAYKMERRKSVFLPVCLVGIITTLNFFFDTLTADTAGQFGKACISVPFVPVTALVTGVICEAVDR